MEIVQDHVKVANKKGQENVCKEEMKLQKIGMISVRAVKSKPSHAINKYVVSFLWDGSKLEALILRIHVLFESKLHALVNNSFDEFLSHLKDPRVVTYSHL